MATEMKELAPADEPWTLIRQAIEDLEDQEQLPHVEICMSHWNYFEGDTCLQCLAGCVVANRISDHEEIRSLAARLIPERMEMELSPSDFPQFCDRLRALDYFRRSDVQSGLYKLGLKADHPFDDDIPGYHGDPSGFKVAMRKLADRLEEEKDQIRPIQKALV